MKIAYCSRENLQIWSRLEQHCSWCQDDHNQIIKGQIGASQYSDGWGSRTPNIRVKFWSRVGGSHFPHHQNGSIGKMHPSAMRRALKTLVDTRFCWFSSHINFRNILYPLTATVKEYTILISVLIFTQVRWDRPGSRMWVPNIRLAALLNIFTFPGLPKSMVT